MSNEKCLTFIFHCMTHSKLKLDPDKTEFIVFGSKAQHQNLFSHFTVNIFSIFFILMTLLKT